ncbi:Folate transporter 1, chloroplastic [Porphyridium purpureum]|uniref:Folate transporter 1, chloroplastic n=1 Tax=Porphyridium purpureum TaxID=35688 RepID=A0A5J4Z6V3_PORPP|nr:Folate transporter 1, chloroplastic [Porphyridium purpureum]|eukprot:POR4713..scf295_1
MGEPPCTRYEAQSSVEAARPAQTAAIHGLAGALGGLANILVFHPLDTVKTRLQAAERAIAVGFGKDVSRGWLRSRSRTLDTLMHIRRTEGVRALYNGLFPAMLGGTLSWSFYFYWYNMGKQYARDLGFAPTPASHFMIATSAGAITAVLTNPIWVVKTRMQLESMRECPASALASSAAAPAQRPYFSFFDGMRCILHTEGVQGLYRGLIPSLWLVSQGALQFVVYEECKRWLLARRAVDYAQSLAVSLSVPESLVAATTSKLVASLTTYPLQVVRTRMQKRGVDPARYGSLHLAVTSILRNEGVLGFYKGMTANIMRVTPSAAVTFVVYESVVGAYFRIAGA